MKSMFISIGSMILLAVVFFTACNSSTEKVADARENVKEAEDDVAEAEYDLYVAKNDSSTEYQNFIRESEDRIASLDKRIAEFKLKITKEQRNVRNESLELLKKFEQKTVLMKKELYEYKEDKNDDWKVFRNEFNKDMDKLGQSITNSFSDAK